MSTVRDQIRLHKSALNDLDAIKPSKPRRRRRPHNRVQTRLVDPLVWRTALALANYDAHRLTIVSPTQVRVQ